VSHGGRTYVFQLRSGIRYSTGALVRPADVRRGIERSLALQGGSAPTAGLTSIVGGAACATRRRCDLSKGIVVDDRAGMVTFHLTDPDPDFLYKLALPAADAVPADTPLAAALPLPATGPYVVAAVDPTRGIVRLTRNPRFRLWSVAAQPDGYPDAIVERYGYSGASAAQAVLDGRADVTGDGPDQTWSPDLAGALRTRHSSQLHVTPAIGTVSVWLNTRIPPFDDVRVRRALNYAVDRNRLIALAGGPEFAKVGCQLLPPNTEGYRGYCPYTAHPDGRGGYTGPDLVRARRLVSESGTRGERVTLWFYDIPIGIRNGTYIVSVLRDLGYDARLRTVPHAAGTTWRADRQAGVGGWTTDYPAANDFFTSVLTCASYDPTHPLENLNGAAFCNRRIDAQIASARQLEVGDPVAASARWSSIDRQLTDAAPWLVIRTQLAPDLVSRRTKNYTYCYLAAQIGITGACLDQLWVR
jgi:peptide/nickel transport system substrate-binding protein